MTMISRKHWWQGVWVSDEELEAKLQDPTWARTLLEKKLPLSHLLQVLRKFKQSALVKGSEVWNKLSATISEWELCDVSAFLAEEALLQKVKKELGLNFLYDDPWVKRQAVSGSGIFEGWVPLGIVAHITPGNVSSVGALSVIEALLVGNVNILKCSHEDHFSPLFLEELAKCDESGLLSHFILLVNLSSKERELLRKVVAPCDGVVVWGGEGALLGVRELVGANTRIIPYGPKISFSYVSRKGACATTYEKIASDITQYEQEACSSPQIVFVEAKESERGLLLAAAKQMAAALEVCERTTPPRYHPSSNEWAEITMACELHHLESALGMGEVLRGKGWRVLLSFKSELRSSPLFRTIWVIPLEKSEIHGVLFPYRAYLQSAGVEVAPEELSALAHTLWSAGVTRVTEVGKMHEGYVGEAHDGEMALTRVAKRVSLVTKQQAFLSRTTLREDFALEEERAREIRAHAPMSKAHFQQLPPVMERVDLVFKSGGSSGDSKISTFSYEDYHYQMYAAAGGLLAAGLKPQTDLVMNLFYAGGLYGGFLSFYTILEFLRARQLPMAAHQDFSMVADTIIRFKIDTLVGMPSYLRKLFSSEEESGRKLKAYAGVKKIFYGGEHFTPKQQQYFKEEFALALIRSASYGSVDAGPLGYQCEYCEGGVHHLQADLQYLEIFKLDQDLAVTEESEVGRLLFTSLARHGHKLIRYEIGDLGRWVSSDGRCKCGRTSPTFELLGRYGDVFKCGGSYLNYEKFLMVLADVVKGDFDLQLTLSSKEGCDHLLLATVGNFSREHYKEELLQSYHDLREVYVEGILLLEVKAVAKSELQTSSASGKILRVIDLRLLAC
ncbi:MAG: hypothetical protein HQK52_09465 [Oligoflexia bacterium]|nr:hypothetical protein [Oligoflexia bacterium]